MEQEVVKSVVDMPEQFILFLGWLGFYCPMILGAMGSILGCGIAGNASFGAMLEAEEGHFKFMVLSILPSSQIFYGFLVMFLYNDSVQEVGINASNGIALFSVGILCGVTLLLSAIRQGQCCAAGMNTIKTKPELFGLSFVSPAAIEAVALFAFVFTFLIKETIFMVN